MREVVTVGINTFREAFRNKVIHTILGLAFTVILCSKVLAWVSAGEDVKVMIDMGLAAITFFGVLVAMFSGASLLYREMEMRTSYLILSRPIKRYQFVLGKYLGLSAVLVVSVAVMGAVHAGYLSTFMFSTDPEILSRKLVFTYLEALAQAYFLIAVELCVIAAVAILFSTVSTPTFSAVGTFCVFFIGHGLRNLEQLKAEIPAPIVHAVLTVLYYVLPALFTFDMKHRAAYADPKDVLSLLLPVGYAATYTAVLLIASCGIFGRKQL